MLTAERIRQLLEALNAELAHESNRFSTVMSSMKQATIDRREQPGLALFEP
jgi:hypothetical protein